MPKIILRCNYLRSAPSEHLSNFVNYIGTRDGVDIIDKRKSEAPATLAQQKVIAEILTAIDDAKEMLEYQDYVLKPTRENATEFITMALENNLDLVAKKKNYVDYLANRPRVDKFGTHGLFNADNTPIVLSAVADEIANHEGVIWTNVISLRREDAVRLGFDNAKAWQKYLGTKADMLAEHFKINAANLKFYAAFHNESHHPHVHLVVYSQNPKEGFLTEQAIKKMRSALAHDLFREDFMEIYNEQTLRRDALKAESQKSIEDLISQMQNHICSNPKIESLMNELVTYLGRTKGKLQYGYLSPPIKSIIDRIVDELEKEPLVAESYGRWYQSRNEILLTYMSNLPPPIPLSEQKEFKSIKNMIINEAVKIKYGVFTFEGDDEPDAPEVVIDESTDAVTTSLADTDERGEFVPNVNWSEQYKLARAYLYGSGNTAQDFAKAFELFMSEAQSGNAFAMADLGRIYADGLGVEIDTTLSYEWYAMALTAFLAVENAKSNAYIKYRIGKLYNTGLGTEQDYTKAAEWFSLSAAQKNQFAQYSLGGLYYHGKGVEQSYERAFELYLQSASKGNAFAAYELAKMHRDGVGTDKNIVKADECFKKAFIGFVSLESKTKEDKLQYRLGQMLYSGTGTEKDIPKAIDYLEEASKLGNVNAQYLLSKIYLEQSSTTENIQKALEWLSKSADSGNPNAQYALGKFYRDGTNVDRDIPSAIKYLSLSAEQEKEFAQYALGKLYLKDDTPKDVATAIKWLTASAEQGNQFAQYAIGKLYLQDDTPKDIATAVKWLTASAEQGNEFAQYSLGKLHLSGENIPQNIEKSVLLLTQSAEQGNQFAQYALGKLYLMGKDVPRDKELALKWLTASAAQGNIYAQFLIDHFDSFKEPSVLLAATRLMRHLSDIFKDDVLPPKNNPLGQIDRKRRQEVRRKKIAQGHAEDEQIQVM